jgi:hypothetical protein
MFGFSPTKLIFTIAIVAAVWYGFKFLGRMSEKKEATKTPTGNSNRSNDAAPSSDPAAVEMIQCKTCGDYVASSNARSCGREDCPYPG